MTQLTFTSGSSVGTVVCELVVINNDNILEDDEFFTITMSTTETVSVVISSDANMATVTISEDASDGMLSYPALPIPGFLSHAV